MSNKITSMKMNRRCRSEFYPRTNIERLLVPDEKVPWEANWPKYSPPDFTAPHILILPGSDPHLPNPAVELKWNVYHDGVDRISWCGKYAVIDGRPLNPFGRTGLQGRGLLRRWGPNQETYSFVTQWKMEDGQTVVDESSKKPILQVLAKRSQNDDDQWEIPRSAVEFGAFVNETLIRAFLGTDKYLVFPDYEWKSTVYSFFDQGVCLVRGFVDDPRNTDNAWVETAAVLYHDEKGKVTSAFPETVQNGARNFRWVDVNADLKFEAKLCKWCMKKAAIRLRAHWGSYR